MEEETAQSPEQITSVPPSTAIPEILPTSAKPKPWLKIFLFSVLGTVAVSALIFGAYKFGQREVKPASQPTPTPVVVATPTPDQTANWKTYKGKNFIMKYPNDWNFQEREYLNTVSFENKNGAVSLEISEGQYPYGFGDGMTMESKSIAVAVNGEEYQTKETIAENKAVFVDFGIDSPYDHHVLFGTGYPAGSASKASLPDYYQEKEIILKMLSTFKFLPSESSEIIPSPSPTPSLRKISYRNIPGWPLYKSLLDFDFQYPPDYSLPQKNVVDFMNLGQFYCSFPSSKKVGTGLDYLNFIALPKNYEEKIQRTLKILNAPGILKTEEVELYSYPAVILDLDQSYKHYQKDQALVVEAGSMLLIVNYKQNEINKNWDYILESIRFGSNFDKDYFEEKLNECRG